MRSAIGAILYSVPHRCVLQQLSTLLPVVGENPVRHINHISAEASRAHYHYKPVLELFQQWHDTADYLIAHNAEFDKKWFGQNILPLVTKPWLCTCHDFLWSKATRSHLSLVKLAQEHGISFDIAHRALTDCQLIASLFNQVSDFEAMLIQAIQRSQNRDNCSLLNGIKS